MSLSFLTIPQKSLSQSITSASSTFKLNNIKSFAVNSLGVNINLVAGDFGTQAFGVFRNATGTIIEVFEFDPTTIASTSVTILKRGLNFDGDLTTETTNYKLDWPAGSIVMLGTDAPQVFQWLKEYIDGIAVAGSPNASETAKGIVEEATDAETSAGTATGATGAKLFVTPAKLKSTLNSNGLFTIETTTGVTHSLTTIASQKVVVWVKGTYAGNGGAAADILLKYNTVTKDTLSVDVIDAAAPEAFSMMYTETPGAATANITVTSSYTLANVVIIVMKIG